MGGDFSKLRNFLYDVSRRRKREGLWDEKYDQPSPVGLAERTKINISTIQRILAGHRKTVADADRKRPGREYAMTKELADKLKDAFGFQSRWDLEEEIERAAQAPPWRSMRHRRND